MTTTNGTNFVLYSSVAEVAEQDPANLDIVTIAIERNRAQGVTGFLHREEDLFFQWIEGPAAVVDTLWQAIRRDPRHSRITELATGALPLRQFERWSMGYSTQSRASLFDWMAEKGGSRRSDDPNLILEFLRHSAAAQPL